MHEFYAPHVALLAKQATDERMPDGDHAVGVSEVRKHPANARWKTFGRACESLRGTGNTTMLRDNSISELEEVD